ncbi:hypothetical protein M405DRAFT_808883 [Rhizopogon salebrosus TDB-379]|nr:hypothetical protein M405DRAFT_808883 [Rhizopogon salebrosus TDB-379]
MDEGFVEFPSIRHRSVGLMGCIQCEITICLSIFLYFLQADISKVPTRCMCKKSGIKIGSKGGW